ncbi:LOW QUALITY PROTEIN: hypothetical protein PanWU01x14_268600 [Parasponia andersonii]|uniref:Uncharacterized protein n=1 Tax=Parasponia andersonii TaxID=3476 RepID=A0A2P5B615_PARAD|nr:LOW QUALITY PROTEIN: hypothetical protein PanWU01x14_268600 [Parasponia andersonii]
MTWFPSAYHISSTIAYVKCHVFNSKRVSHLMAMLCHPKALEGYLHTRLTIYKLLPPIHSYPFLSLVITSSRRSRKFMPKVVTLLKWLFDSKVMSSQNVQGVYTHSSYVDFATYYMLNLLRLTVATRLGHIGHELGVLCAKCDACLMLAWWPSHAIIVASTC